MGRKNTLKATKIPEPKLIAPIIKQFFKVQEGEFVVFCNHVMRDEEGFTCYIMYNVGKTECVGFLGFNGSVWISEKGQKDQSACEDK